MGGMIFLRRVKVNRFSVGGGESMVFEFDGMDQNSPRNLEGCLL
jgi:hypothetical protein